MYDSSSNMKYAKLTISNRHIVGYELEQHLWYVDLHDISKWLYIDYEVSEIQQILTPDYARYLIPVEDLGRAILLDHIYNPRVESQELLETLLATDLSTQFSMVVIVDGKQEIIDYLEDCYHLKYYE